MGRGNMRWTDLTTEEFDAIDRTTPVVLPTAAVEQHGPHLPVVTDTLIAEHFCSRLDQQRLDRVLILPTVTVGYSRHHQDFAGTLSLSHEVFAGQVSDMAASVFAQGFRNLLIFNAHGGNVAIGTVVLETLGAQHPDRNVAFTSWWQVAGPELLMLSESGRGGVGHGCELETSLMLYAAPERVRTALIPERTNQPEFDWDAGDLLRASRARIYRPTAQASLTGVIGTPRLASSDKGKEITSLVVSKLTTIVDSLGSAK